MWTRKAAFTFTGGIALDSDWNDDFQSSDDDSRYCIHRFHCGKLMG